MTAVLLALVRRCRATALVAALLASAGLAYAAGDTGVLERKRPEPSPEFPAQGGPGLGDLEPLARSNGAHALKALASLERLAPNDLRVQYLKIVALVSMGRRTGALEVADRFVGHSDPAANALVDLAWYEVYVVGSSLEERVQNLPRDGERKVLERLQRAHGSAIASKDKFFQYWAAIGLGDWYLHNVPYSEGFKLAKASYDEALDLAPPRGSHRYAYARFKLAAWTDAAEVAKLADGEHSDLTMEAQSVREAGDKSGSVYDRCNGYFAWGFGRYVPAATLVPVLKDLVNFAAAEQFAQCEVRALRRLLAFYHDALRNVDGAPTAEQASFAADEARYADRLLALAELTADADDMALAKERKAEALAVSGNRAAARALGAEAAVLKEAVLNRRLFARRSAEVKAKEEALHEVEVKQKAEQKNQAARELNIVISAVAVVALVLLLFAVVLKRKGEAVSRLHQERAERAQREAELAHQAEELARLGELSAKIAPHFLYNTFSLIKSLVTSDTQVEREKAGAVLDQLTRFLRLLYKTDDAVQSTLEVEFQRSALYLDIMKVMYPEFQYETSLPDELKSCLFPPLVIQTFLENAFKHAWVDKSKQMRIDVRAVKSGAQVKLQVRDDGRGPGKAGAGSTGLQNIRSRLDKLYQGEATYRVVPGEEGGTLVEVTTPLISDGDASSPPMATVVAP